MYQDDFTMATILAVDDSASMRQMVSFTLQGAGHKVIEAEDGVIAYDLAMKTNNVDLVLSDVNMPNMDGLQLIKALRFTENYKFTPMLMLTTESTKEKKWKERPQAQQGGL